MLVPVAEMSVEKSPKEVGKDSASSAATSLTGETQEPEAKNDRQVRDEKAPATEDERESQQQEKKSGAEKQDKEGDAEKAEEKASGSEKHKDKHTVTLDPEWAVRAKASRDDCRSLTAGHEETVLGGLWHAIQDAPQSQYLWSRVHVLNGFSPEFKGLDFSNVLGQLYWLKRKHDRLTVRLWDVVVVSDTVPNIGGKRALVCAMLAEWYGDGKKRKVKVVVVATPSLSGVTGSCREEISASNIDRVDTEAYPDDSTLATAWFYAGNAIVGDLRVFKTIAAQLHSDAGAHQPSVKAEPGADGQGSKKRKGKSSSCSLFVLLSQRCVCVCV